MNGILLQPFKVVNKNNLNEYLYNPSGESVLEFILDAGWKRSSVDTPTRESSKEIYS